MSKPKRRGWGIICPGCKSPELSPVEKTKAGVKDLAVGIFAEYAYDEWKDLEARGYRVVRVSVQEEDVKENSRFVSLGTIVVDRKEKKVSYLGPREE